MAKRAEVLREIDTLERIQAELAGIASRTDEERKPALVELRRQLSAQIARVGTLADSLFVASDSEVTRAYRAHFSRMRSRAALHQADWPAVRLGENPEAYRASALGVREANREFVAWMRTTLGEG